MSVNRKTALAACIAMLLPAVLAARTVMDFDADWHFSKSDPSTAMAPAFDDSTWRIVDVPHDWSIEGPFSAELASGTGYAPGGIGWYRKHFKLDESQCGKTVTVEFDGIYDNSEVWINGAFVGGRPYGYSSFRCDLTPYLKYGSDDNVVAVRVDHSRFADSRYYTGSGIYRHVHLCLADELHVAPDGIYVTTSKVEKDSATITIETTIENDSGEKKAVSVDFEILSPDGKSVGKTFTSKKVAGTNAVITRKIMVQQPQLWSPGSPSLYTLKTRITSGDAVADEVVTTFGIRSAVFNSKEGFLLNGVPTKLKGVCIHHDAGCLGAAVPDKVLERRLRLLKEIGVNAIRTSHNPPAPELLDLCDRLGFLVMDEAFDEFTPSKKKWVTGVNNGTPSRFGYAEFFRQWAVIDLRDMVRRDRNHPCIVMWSIGNEIDFANDPFTDPVLERDYKPGNPPASDLVQLAKPLITTVKAEDRTRPVTAALANIKMSESVGLPELFDVVGYNYQESRYADDHKKFPNRVIFGSETFHTYAAWTAVRDNEFVAGQFLWTGIDYLGEAGEWPNRASRAGLLDMCGFKKPMGWFRQSLWSDKPMVYLCAGDANQSEWRGFRAAEQWNWPSNSSITVNCFANCPQVTLRLNDKIIGTQTSSQTTNGVLRWTIPFEPGVLKAIGVSNGQPIAEYTLTTAGPADHVELLADTTNLCADGKDVCHLEIRIVDAKGIRVPDTSSKITVRIDGAAKLLGVEDGDVNNSEPYQGPTHKVFHGRALAILRSTRDAGAVSISVTAEGIQPATLALHSAAVNYPSQ